MGIDVGPLLPTLGGVSDWLELVSPFVVWLGPLLLLVGAVMFLPLVAAGLGKMVGPDLEHRAAGQFDEGYEEGYLGAARGTGRDEGADAYRTDYAGIVADVGDGG